MKCELKTNSGIYFNPLDVQEDQIKICDIAHALSHICRYNGHSNFHYSVGQHSVLLARYALDNYNDKILAKYLLLHDGSEAYLSDIPGPLKNTSIFKSFREEEDKLQIKIFKKFNLNPNKVPKLVHKLDILIRNDEKKVIFNCENNDLNTLGIIIEEKKSKDVKNEFLDLYEYLSEVSCE